MKDREHERRRGGGGRLDEESPSFLPCIVKQPFAVSMLLSDVILFCPG